MFTTIQIVILCLTIIVIFIIIAGIVNKKTDLKLEELDFKQGEASYNCAHDMKEVYESEKYNGSDTTKLPISVTKIYQCSKCGKTEKIII